MKYDYLIVGAGLFGSVFAHEAKKAGKRCLVIDKRSHIGGNVYTSKKEDINVHEYGAHIFHTDNKQIWDYINQFAEFNNYVNSPIAKSKGQIYNLPFNMNTFNKMWGVETPKEAQEKIKEQVKKAGITEPKNLEEQAIALVGTDIYEKLIKEYTEKQWGKKCNELPSFIIKRLPLRFTYNNNYFNDRYQGIPIGGYTQIIEKMLDGVEVLLETDFAQDRKVLADSCKQIIYTGKIDEYFEYCFGELENRSLKFLVETKNESNFQGNAVVNYADEEVPYTRIIEHKHFEFGNQDKTVITYEFPLKWEKGLEPYYPVNDEANNMLYLKYADHAKKQQKTIFGGRLGKYSYLDMDKTILFALELASQELKL